MEGESDDSMDLDNTEKSPHTRKQRQKVDPGIPGYSTVLPYQFEPEWSTSDEDNPNYNVKSIVNKVTVTKDTTTSEEESSTEDSLDSDEDEYNYYNSDDDDIFSFYPPDGPILPYQFEPLASPLTEEEEQAKADLAKRLGNTDWCICGQCVEMKRPEECFCCREADEVDELVEKSCITEHKEFYSTCIDMHQLKLAYLEEVNGKFWKKPREPEQGEIFKKYRYVAYKRFTRWCYWELPIVTPLPVPSCVTMKIKEALPSDKQCGLTLHVRKSKNKK